MYGQIDTLTKLLGQMSHRQNGIPLFNVTLTQKKALYLNRHIINTLTNVTRTNVTQTNCHLDKILPFRCHNQVSSVTSIFSSGQMSPGQMSLGQMSPGQILPCQPCSTAQLDHQKHLFPLVPSLGPSVENPDAAEAGKCGWCLRKQEGAAAGRAPGQTWLYRKRR